MEKIFKVKASELVNIKEKFDQFTNELCPEGLDRLPETYDEIKQLLDIQNADEEELLDDSISLNNLSQMDDVPIEEFHLHEIQGKPGNKIIEIPQQASDNLKCVRERIEDEKAKREFNIPKKYNRYQYIDNSKFRNSNDLFDLQPLKDILILVRVYEPFIYKRGVPNNRKPRLSQEFYVLGSQRLNEFRDKIYCHSEFGPFLDVSNDFESIKRIADNKPRSSAENSADKGIFFITNTFYKDSSASEKDFPNEIREWISRQADIEPTTIKTMHEMKFEDLNIRLGFPQLYRHYGNCEHVFTFSDIRLLDSSDSLKSSDYPLLRCISSSKNTLCAFCGVIEATFIVKKSSVHLQDPTYLCQNCLISFHYIDGKKNGNFQVFRYYGNRPILN